MEQLSIHWPELKIVHGKPPHRQSQGTVESQPGHRKYIGFTDER